LVVSLETNDTFKGFQGGFVRMPTVVPPPQPKTKKNAQGASGASGSAAASNAHCASKPIMMDVGIETDDLLAPELMPLAPKAKAMPKSKLPPPPTPAMKAVFKLCARNEHAQLVDPDKLVAWGKMLIPPQRLERVLETPAATQHIKARIPRMGQIIAAVDEKMEEPEMKAFCTVAGMFREEARCLMACTFDFGVEDKRGNLFKELNVDLRMLSTLRGCESHTALKQLWAPFIRRMTVALTKMPKLKLPKCRIWRGRPESVEEISKIYGMGREVIWSGITSCTRNKEYAAYMASWHMGTVLEITVLLDIYDISPISFYPAESEVLLPPNTKLVVLGKPRKETMLASDGSPWTVNFVDLMQTEHTQIIS